MARPPRLDESGPPDSSPGGDESRVRLRAAALNDARTLVAIQLLFVIAVFSANGLLEVNDRSVASLFALIAACVVGLWSVRKASKALHAIPDSHPDYALSETVMRGAAGLFVVSLLTLMLFLRELS